MTYAHKPAFSEDFFPDSANKTEYTCEDRPGPGRRGT